MSKYDNLPFNDTMEKVVNILRKKTQNENPTFFRLIVSYYFSKIASMMRLHVALGDAQTVPVNMYAINLAPSGSGKGHSITILEDNVIGPFRQRFTTDTFPKVASKNIAALAVKRALRKGTDDKEELQHAELEFIEHGEMLFSFDSGTGPALKQMRNKLLMAGAGSMNLEMDEIGSNFTGNQELLNSYLELFDTGRIKPKLVKNTRENIRSEDLIGVTPCNMMLFGTPTKLLNGGKEEELFYSMQETGFARRCFFGYSRFRENTKNMTPQKMYDLYHDPITNGYLQKLSDKLQLLADMDLFNQVMKFKPSVLMEWYAYQIWCEEQAAQLTEFEEVRKAEIIHRYFKVAKLAAVYAYIDRSAWIEQVHLENAIAMAEESGIGFKKILNRERNYEKLAYYIVSMNKQLTHADLTEDLSFYRGSEQVKKEMMNLAIAYGYRQGMYIKKEISDGIEFFSGKRAVETDLDKIILAWSKEFTSNYKNEVVPFSKLHRLVNRDNLHWVSHALRDGYRDDAHCIPGVNLICLDIENSVDIDTAKLLLADYKWLIHTTKRHTDTSHRFRILIPMSHQLELDERDYKEFMQNVFEWLPFDADTQTGQRSRKWMTCKGNFWYNDGQLLDVLQFIPKTKKAEETKQTLSKLTNLTNLERWFVSTTKVGNRNQQLAKYAFACVGMGQDVQTVRNNVLALNNKIENPLDTVEIDSTIMISVTKRVAARQGGHP